MLADMLNRLTLDPGHRTLGELLQERQWAVDEILRLRHQLERAIIKPKSPAAPGPQKQVKLEDGLAARRLLRLFEVMTMTGLSRSTIYKMVAEQRFPDRVQVGVRAVRWRAADIIAWENERVR
jgi:prophage regulatory protein